MEVSCVVNAHRSAVLCWQGGLFFSSIHHNSDDNNGDGTATHVGLSAYLTQCGLKWSPFLHNFTLVDNMYKWHFVWMAFLWKCCAANKWSCVHLCGNEIGFRSRLHLSQKAPQNHRRKIYLSLERMYISLFWLQKELRVNNPAWNFFIQAFFCQKRFW